MSDHENHEIVPGQESTHHVTSPRTFVVVLIALTVLMVATIFAAEGLHLHGLLGNIVALSIACTKATLVVMFFMGVLFATKLTKLYAVLGFIWVTLLGMTFCDYFTRTDEVAPRWTWEKAAPQTGMNVPLVGKELPRQLF
jgi:cytochrome c oxidase subunit 4